MKKLLIFSFLLIHFTFMQSIVSLAWDGPGTLTGLIEKIGVEAHGLVPEGETPCDAHAKEIIKKHMNTYHEADYIQSRFVEVGNLLETIDDKARARSEDPPVDKGWYRSVMDKVIASKAATADYPAFIRMLTGKEAGNLNDTKRFRELYNLLEEIEKDFKSVAMMPILHMNGCHGLSQIVFGTQGLSFPHIQWAGYINFSSKCSCQEQDATKAKEVKYLVQFTVRSTMETTEVKVKEGDKEVTKMRAVPRYEDPRNFRVRTYEVECCPPEEEDDEDISYMDPFMNEDISMPDEADYFIDYFVDEMMSGELSPEEEDELFDQLFAISLGLGYNRSEDELGFCTGFGYHRRILKLDRANLFVGGDALFDFGRQNVSSSRYKVTNLMVGPKAEMYIPLKSNVVSLKTGLGGGFGYGVQNRDGQKDNFTMGYLDLLIGLYLQCKSIAFGLETPLFQYQRFKFRYESGDYTDSNVGVNLNKKTPLKASVVVPLIR